MVINLIFGILLLVVTQESEKSDYHLTPASPPLGFLAQYYTVNLRVIGLPNPTFSYDGLPPFLAGSENGTIEGIPDQIGSFLVKVKYSSGTSLGQDEIILRVTTYLSQQQMNNTSNTFQILYPNSSLAFVTGNRVNLHLYAQNGKNPYIWSITNLPPGLFADTKGNINGTVIQQGYYTISVSVSDMSGKSAYSYFVFNVQPKNSNSGLQLVQVQNRNTNQQYNLTEIENQQVQATKAIFEKARMFYQAQNNTTFYREKITNTTIAMQQAQAKAQVAQKRVSTISGIQSLASAIFAKVQQILKTVQNNYQLSQTNYNNFIAQLQKYNKAANQSLTNFEDARQRLNEASKDFISAQNESLLSVLNLKLALKAYSDANDSYQSSFKTYNQAKSIIQDQQNNLLAASFLVDAVRNTLNLANQANDGALSNLKMIQNIYEKTNSILNSTQILVQKFTNDLDDAKNDLQSSKFSLVQALNRLYVAQAAKAEADKATAILSFQAVQNINLNTVNINVFNGCEQGAYPTISGSAYISEINAYSVKLTTGNILVFGACSNLGPNIYNGMLATFIGYMKEGYIHLLQLKRASV